MELLEENIIQAYVNEKLSEQQTSLKYNVAPHKVRKILNSFNIPRRSRSEASRLLHITKFGARDFHLKEKLSFEEHQLKVAGTMLYWGEGTKRGGTVALSNSNPEMIKLFIRFLRIICGIDDARVHITLHHYEDHDPSEIMKFWSDLTEIPLSQFYKPYLHIRRKGTYRTPSKYGTISVQYSDSNLLEKILDWIKEYEKLCSN
jgi:hypothetical protein